MYLNCRTYFSVRYGTYSTEELVNTAAEHGIHVLALTNINCTCDSWDFVNFCQQKEIRPVLAVEIRNEDEKKLFFKEVCRVLEAEGRVHVVEHLQDLPNFLAFNLGFFSFCKKINLDSNICSSRPANCFQQKIKSVCSLFYSR